MSGPVEDGDETTTRQALERCEARYRALGAAISQAVWAWDPATGEGEHEALQRWWEELTGQSPEEQSANDRLGWLDRVHPEDREQARHTFVGALASGTPYETEYRILTRDGDVRYLQARAVPVRDPAGGVLEWVGTLADITARRRAEEELRQSAEQLKQDDRRKDEFLAMLAHELRNPLAPIRNAVEILRRLGPPDPRLKQARAMIERQVAHMARLVDDLLDVSRISRGKVLLRTERFDLVPVVHAAVEDHRTLLEGNGLLLTVELPGEPLWILGDPTRLSQVVGNLLQNSNKFTNAGGRVTVRLAATEAGEAVLTVEDTGIGLEPEILSRLFEPFSQADRSLDRSRGGLGLGLALVKGLVELHGGSVEAASGGQGSGSKFTVRLPTSPEPMPAGRTAAASSGPSAALRILVVEDHADAAESLRILLELSGHEATVVATGHEGLETARRLRPDVALCDIGLPGGMDGYALARALRAAPETAGIYLIAMTGYGQEEDRQRAFQAGFDRHLTKPMNPAALFELLATLTSR